VGAGGGAPAKGAPLGGALLAGALLGVVQIPDLAKPAQLGEASLGLRYFTIEIEIGIRSEKI
jgi:hypothetical protein